jgi:hypothetical protein
MGTGIGRYLVEAHLREGRSVAAPDHADGYPNSARSCR